MSIGTAEEGPKWLLGSDPVGRAENEIVIDHANGVHDVGGHAKGLACIGGFILLGLH